MKFYEIKTIYLDLSDEYNWNGTSKEFPNDYEKAFDNCIWDTYRDEMSNTALQYYFGSIKGKIIKTKLVDKNDFVINVKIKQEINPYEN